MMSNIIHEISENDWLERPLFITGQMKSGGTLFHALLDGNPEMFVYPDQPYFRLLFQREYHNKKHMIIDWLLGNRNVLQQPKFPLFNFDPTNEKVPISLDYANTSIDSLELVGEIRGGENWSEEFSIEEYHKLLKEYLSVPNLTKREVIWATVLAAVASQSVLKPEKLKRWAYRQAYTAVTAIGEDVKRQNNEVEAFFEMFPKGQVLFLVRDPRATVLSRRDHFQLRRSTGKLAKFISLLNDAKVVRESFKELYELENKYGKSKLKVVRYEDITNDPKASMSDICSFIGISFSETMLHPTVFGLPKQVITAHGFDGKKLNQKRAIRWKQDLSLFQILFIESMLTEGLEFHGSRWGYKRQLNLIPSLIVRYIVILPLSAAFRLGYSIIQLLRSYILSNLSLNYSKNIRRHVYNADAKANVAVARDWYHRPNIDVILKHLSQIIQKKNLCGYERVLDVGSRYGLWSLALAKYSEKIVGLEPIPDFVAMANQEMARLQVDGVQFVQGELETYEPTEKVDLIHLRSVLHNNNIDRNVKVQKLISMLEPTGRLYITYFGPGQAVLNLIAKCRKRNLRGAFLVVKSIILTLVYRNILGRKNYPFSFLTRKGFIDFLKSNNLEPEYIGYIDSPLDGDYPARIGPFVREFDALCKRKKI